MHLGVSVLALAETPWWLPWGLRSCHGQILSLDAALASDSSGVTVSDTLLEAASPAADCHGRSKKGYKIPWSSTGASLLINTQNFCKGASYLGVSKQACEGGDSLSLGNSSLYKALALRNNALTLHKKTPVQDYDLVRLKDLFPEFCCIFNRHNTNT